MEDLSKAELRVLLRRFIRFKSNIQAFTRLNVQLSAYLCITYIRDDRI
jgi:hypothetical protein